jgi:adenine-specific DNA-methyltransferase
MPTLNWIGKEAVVKHHKEVPYRLLEPVAKLSCGDTNSGNLIVQGDNLHALKALLPRYAGQVKCIYIDPPYNTGNEGWVYNDNVNSPEIKRWLGEVVGREGETLDRHDRWLCMMYPRLLLLKQFLREDGAIFVSIDDNEVAPLRLLMDEVFGSRNFVTGLTWKSRAKPSNTGEAKLKPQNDAEYILCYKKNNFPKFKLISSGKDRSYPHTDKDGKYRLQTILKSNRGESKRETMQFELNGYKPPSTKRWQAGEDTIRDLFERNRITFQTGEPMLKYYEHEEADEFSPFYCHVNKELSGTAESGKKTLNEVLGIEHGFDTVKPLEIIRYLLDRILFDGELILDSFAGSGSTGHAVLKQNAEDGGNRRFILVEMDENIARNVTSKRVRNVAQGYTNGKEQAVAGLGGGFQFCTLSKEPLFTAQGQIRADVTFAQLAEFVWFVETGTGLTNPAGSSPLLGIHDGRAIYLLYNGILKDKSVAGGNVLTGPVYDILPPHDGPKVIFAAASRLGAARLAREQIAFKQTPYALGV